MPYSTALAAANVALEWCGINPIPDVASYSNPAALDKYQRQATIYLDYMQRELGLVFNKRHFWRVFNISTTPTGQTSYPCPAGVIIEGFKANSFFNVTASGVYNGQLAVVTHTQWREMYPNPDQVAPGFPTMLVPVPEDGSGTVRVILFPYPSQVFTIEGQCRLLISPLTAGDQALAFPQHYEHMVIHAVRKMLEESRNEGRAFDAERHAQKVVDEVLRDATGAEEEIYPSDTGISLWHARGEYRRDYNPATDVVPPYTG